MITKGCFELKKKIWSIIIAFLLLFLTFPVCAETNSVLFEAEAFKEGSKAMENVYKTITYMTVSETGSLLYEINIPESGKYALYFKTAGKEDALVNLSLNGEPLMPAQVRKSGSLTNFDDNRYICDFPEGVHSFKLSVTKGTFHLDFIEMKFLSGATDEKYECFLAEINGVKTPDEAEGTVLKYSEILGIDTLNATNGIFYTEPIYDELLSHEYDNVNDFLAKFYSTVKQYKKTPDISMYSGNLPITELKSGNLTMLVRTGRISSPAMIIGAIYKNSRLYKMNYGTYTTQASIKVPFDGVEIDENENYSFKAFYVENLNSVKSIDIYPDVFREIYVSQNGNDENAGTKEMPVKTLSAAKDIVAQISDGMTGDIVIYINEGEYFLPETEVFTAAHGGKNGYNVIIKGTDSENPPVLHGGKKVSGWTEYKDGIYKAPIDAGNSVRNFYVNGYAATRARCETLFRAESEFDDPSTEEKIDGYSVLSKRMPYNFERPEDLEMVWELYWVCQRIPVSEILTQGDKTIFVSDSKEALNYKSSTVKLNVDTGKNFYLENAMELLDREGEFYYNPEEKMIYYYPHEGETIDNAYIAQTEGLFEIGLSSESAKTENIIFENLDIRYGAWDEVSDVGLVSSQADNLLDMTGTSGRKMMHSQILINNASGIDFKNCEFSCLGSNAIILKDNVSDCKITGNIIRDISGAGISVGSWDHTPTNTGMCTNIEIKNNLIRRTSQEYRGTVAITVYYANSINICHNDIADIPYTGISVGWGWGYDAYNAGNISICHNNVTDVMNCLKDGSQIYTLGPLKDSAIYENYLADSKYVIAGIYNDSGSSYLNIFRNVIQNEKEDSYWWYQGLNHTKDLHAYSNFVVNGNVNETDETNKEEGTVLISKDNMSKEALDIKNNAGLEEEYKNLLTVADLPEYKMSIVKHSPKDLYANVYMRYASEYDRCYDPTTGAVSAPNREYVSFCRQEWMEYDVWAQKAGTYSLSIVASNGWEEKKPAYISVSTDGKKQIDYTVTPSNGWTPFVEYEVGNIELKEGLNTIKFKNESVDYYGFHFSYIIIE